MHPGGLRRRGRPRVEQRAPERDQIRPGRVGNGNSLLDRTNLFYKQILLRLTQLQRHQLLAIWDCLRYMNMVLLLCLASDFIPIVSSLLPVEFLFVLRNYRRVILARMLLSITLFHLRKSQLLSFRTLIENIFLLTLDIRAFISHALPLISVGLSAASLDLLDSSRNIEVVSTGAAL